MKTIFTSILPIFWAFNAHAYSTGLPMPPVTLAAGQTINVGTLPNVTLASGQTLNTFSWGKAPIAQTRLDYSLSNVISGSYTTLVSSMTSVVTQMEVFDSSGQTMAFAFGSAGSEVVKIYDYPGGNGLIPILIPQGTRLSIKAISGNATSGELDINFY